MVLTNVAEFFPCEDEREILRRLQSLGYTISRVTTNKRKGHAIIHAKPDPRSRYRLYVKVDFKREVLDVMVQVKIPTGSIRESWQEVMFKAGHRPEFLSVPAAWFNRTIEDALMKVSFEEIE